MIDRYEREVQEWRERRLAALTGPEGWLSVVGLAWLDEGRTTVGSDPSNDVVLPEGGAPARLGWVDVAGGRATLHADPSAGLLHAGQPVSDLELEDDAGGRPTILRLGPLAMHLIARDGRLALRIKDREAPARLAFAGIRHYPVDRRWRFEGRFEPNDPPRTASVPTVLDITERYVLPGMVAFDFDGRTHRLEAFLERPGSDYLLAFADLTNGDDTYPGGRFLYVRPPGPDGGVVVDFNRAYNPPCVFTPHATCALPPPQNRLPFPVLAGELRYRPEEAAPVEGLAGPAEGLAGPAGGLAG
jgi:uncharacterized protein